MTQDILLLFTLANIIEDELGKEIVTHEQVDTIRAKMVSLYMPEGVTEEQADKQIEADLIQIAVDLRNKVLKAIAEEVK